MEESKNRTIVMLRHPEDRLVSGFLHNLHDCPALRRQKNVKIEDKPHSPVNISMQAICVDIGSAAATVRNPNNATTWDLDLVHQVQSLVQSCMHCVGGVLLKCY